MFICVLRRVVGTLYIQFEGHCLNQIKTICWTVSLDSVRRVRKFLLQNREDVRGIVAYALWRELQALLSIVGDWVWKTGACKSLLSVMRGSELCEEYVWQALCRGLSSDYGVHCVIWKAVLYGGTCGMDCGGMAFCASEKSILLWCAIGCGVWCDGGLYYVHERQCYLERADLPC